MTHQQHPGLASGPVYLDYNATTPLDPRVLVAMQDALAVHFGNPSSMHAYGDQPRRLLTAAREQVAGLLGARAAEIVLTASGSEADALAIRGRVLAAGSDVPGPPHVVTQATEHPAVLAACAHLERWHGVEVSYLPVDRHGLLDPAAVEAELRATTVLVSVMHANNETGTVQPVRRIAEVTRAHGVTLHVDAAQTAGKLPLDVSELGADLLTVVGHKMYAPKGVAALYVRDGVALEPLVGGGGQERGLRAGTENVALAVGLGAAASLAVDALAHGERDRLTALRDLLHAGLVRQLPGRVHLHGHPEHRLPNTLNVGIEGVSGADLLAATPSVAASTGSACHSSDDGPSTGLLALGLDPAAAASALRLSVGRWTTEEDVVAAARDLAASAR